MKIKSNKGFTLVELLIVIAIVGVLAVAFLPNLFNAPVRSRDGKRIADLNRISNALVEYSVSNGYPDDAACINGSFGDAELRSQLGGAFPTDPLDDQDIAIEGDPDPACSGTYVYVPDPDGNGLYSFGLYAKLETTVESANAACSELALDNVDVSPAAAITASDACLAILVK